jgi:raffinose/stachyose/melibiose transport system permease protein
MNSNISNFFRRNSRNITMYIILTFLAFLALYPILFSIITSFRTESSFLENKLGFPESFYLGNFDHVLNYSNLFRYFGNSLIFVVGGTLLYLILVISSGYAFGQLYYRFKSQVFGVVLFLMIMPQMVLAIPMYKIASRLGMINSLFGAIIICTAFFAPYGCYMMTTYFSSVPQAIRESAKIDGAGAFTTLWSIMMPIGLPMVATISIVAFTSFWNELPFSVLLLQTQDIKTLVLGVALMRGEYGMPTTSLAASVVIAMILPLSVFLFFQRKIDGGATAGAVKG